jgi:LCP family protein required for cell wall assembly
MSDGDERGGSKHLADIVGKVLGLDVQYYVKMDWGGLVGVVDAVGGIDVVPYNDPSAPGLYDVNQDLRLAAGEKVHLNGEIALKLTRARNSDGGYGLPRSNFDREINQQIVLKAVRDKGFSTGVLGNPAKLLSLTDSMGGHILTNIYTREIRSLADAAILMENAVSLPLQGKNADGEEINLVVSGSSPSMPGLGSVVLPVAGEYEYEDIQEYIHNALNHKSTPAKSSDDESAGNAADDTTGGTDDE